MGGRSHDGESPSRENDGESVSRDWSMIVINGQEKIVRMLTHKRFSIIYFNCNLLQKTENHKYSRTTIELENPLFKK